ncbi:uncharacterized protein LOC144451031 [Glandiceps talaboti]
MKAFAFKMLVQYCIVVYVVQLSLTVAEQQNEDTQIDGSQRYGNGIPGIPGVPGTNGLQGPVGPRGDNGIPGTVGPKGNSGSPGLDGTPGEKGDTGELGSRGQPGQKGTTGIQGPKGTKGEIGQKGIDAVEGQNGAKGDRGIKGNKGSMGGQGLQGPIGQKGEVGQVQQQPRVAFSVAKTTSMEPVSSNQVIVYDKVYSNDGNGYNTSTGKFTCPVSGMYYFMFSGMRVQNAHELLACLIKNTEQLPCIWVDDEGTREHGAASTSVIIDLQQGDEIWVRLDSHNALYSDAEEYNTFTGYLFNHTNTASTMKAFAFKFVQYCIVVCVVQLSLTVAQQRDEDAQTDVSQRCGNGIPGIPGVPGTNGLQGPVGIRGENGIPGPVGPKGAIGSPGLDGTPGEKGDTGELGSRGQPGQKGTTGKPGPKGAKGEIGQKGIDGVEGQNGTKGDTGIKGNKGSMGGQGVPGPIGQVQQQPRVAFSVVKTSSMGPVSSSTVIVYEKVYSNDGNGYSTSTGKFTCPVSGMYYFSISGMQQSNSYIFYACLIKNATRLPCIYAHNSGDRLYGAASNSVIIDVDQGDEIWVRLHSGTAVYGGGNEETTFSGYLLYSNTQ